MCEVHTRVRESAQILYRVQTGVPPDRIQTAALTEYRVQTAVLTEYRVQTAALTEYRVQTELRCAEEENYL